MKTKNLFLSMLLTIAALLTGCQEAKDLSVKGVSLNKSAITLKPEATQQLEFTLYPANAETRTVTWTSSDDKIVSISETGVVTAIKPGSATITITTLDGNQTATCAVTVALNDPMNVSGDVEGVWKKYSVVNVTNHINIPAGKSLTIEEGVEVIVNDGAVDQSGTKIEFIVNGDLYCYGTKEAPILFSVNPTKRTSENTFGRLWGGIIGSTTCGAMVLDNVIIEYTGAITTLNSPSVVGGLFKPAGGEGMVAFNTNNTAGKYVIVNSTFRYTGEDAIYVQGGQCIFANNMFYANGETGGEAINVKAGCKVDAAFNLMYNPNTNALKLSSSGQDPTRNQALIKGYNNTIINAGWRRDPDKPKGGSIWIEEGCLAEIYNNLIVNSMFAVRQDSKKLPDQNCKVDFNFYASGTAKSDIPQHIANGTTTAFDGFKDGVKDIIIGLNDKRSTAPGNNDPLFTNFPTATNSPLSYQFDAAWDFTLKAGSPAATGAKTDFTPYFATVGLQINGKTYLSPAPATYFGALGVK